MGPILSLQPPMPRAQSTVSPVLAEAFSDDEDEPTILSFTPSPSVHKKVPPEAPRPLTPVSDLSPLKRAVIRPVLKKPSPATPMRESQSPVASTPGVSRHHLAPATPSTPAPPSKEDHVWRKLCDEWDYRWGSDRSAKGPNFLR